MEKLIIKNQNGNVLVYILIAIGLVAALSFVITKSMQGGGTNISREKSNIIANEIISYGNTISNAIKNLILIEGCNLQEISFENDIDNAYDNSLSPVTDECGIFKHEGGGINLLSPPLDANDGSPYIYSSAYIHGVGNGYDNNQCSTSECTEIVLFLKNINKSICEAINNKLNLESASGTIPKDTGDALMTKFNGNIVEGCGTGSCGNWIGDSNSSKKVLYGQNKGCFEGGGNPPQGTYHYYHVVYKQ